jgi:putative transposase
MQIMGLQAVYPKKNLSKRNHDHKVYPYLLKQFPPLKPHDVWCTDISYIKTATGYVYLTALIDVVSRCVMGWHVSTSLETESCLRALEKAIETGYKPIIINSDQGCQYTSQEWVYQLSLLGVKVSMDGKGRGLDNIPVERLWRTIKYEEVYLRTYETVTEAKQFLEVYINWYNHQRRHSGINYQRPYEVMTGKAQATSWPFQQQKNEQIPGYGYVDNVNTLSHIPTSPTTTTKQQKEKMMMDLSSKIAA